MASEKEPVVTEEQSNGEKNGENGSQKLSLGEIAAIENEIAKAKTDQLQLLHNLFYGKNGSAPQIKRNIRKFAGFETDDRQKKLDHLLTCELPALQQTVTILDIKDVKEDETKENISKVIVDFLMAPTGKTIAEVEKENPVESGEDEQEPEEEEEEDDEEEQVKPKGSSKKNQAGRPKRATASRVWTKGEVDDFGSSEGEEEEAEEEEERPKVGRKRKNDSDSGSDYNPNADSDSEADRRKSARGSGVGTRKVGRPAGRKAKASESESEEVSDEDFSDDELPKKKKAPARAPPKRGRAPAKRGRKRKQESESEEEESADESEQSEQEESDDSDKPKKKGKPAPKSTPQKNSKGRPKRAAPPAKKKKKDESDEEGSDEPEESEDDEPLKKPPKKSGATSPVADGTTGPTDDDIKILLKDILADANLEEITMKTVCKKVYAHYPGHDLTKKKDFIKQTVKSLIAT